MSSIREWSLRLHLYGGLLCSSYLLIFALSSLMFAHPDWFPGEGEARVSWSREVTVDTSLPDDSLAEAVRSSLDLIGWAPPWEVRRESPGVVDVTVERPGKRYRIRVSQNGTRADVEEQRLGYFDVIKKLHAFGTIPGSTFVSTWLLYRELSAAVGLFAVVSGVYLFAARSHRRLVGWLLLAAGSSISGALLLTVWLSG